MWCDVCYNMCDVVMSDDEYDVEMFEFVDVGVLYIVFM